MSHSLKQALLLTLVLAPSMTAFAASTGYIERPWSPTSCLQGSHFFFDPCTGDLTLLSQNPTLPLDPFICTDVILDGPLVGVECQMIQPSTVEASSTSCPVQFDQLWLLDPSPNSVYWKHVPCAASYDVVRGDLSAVTPEISRIDLGGVTCLAEDVPQASTVYIFGPADAASPPLGAVFFYLVRTRSLVLGDETYGHSSDSRERLPSSGDCSF